jgi:hypothetical protein
MLSEAAANIRPVPALLFGIALGPIAARFIDVDRWGDRAAGQQDEITLVCPGIIGQLQQV